MNRSRRVALLTGAVGMALNTACYAYQPVTGVPPGTGQRVRVHLTTDGTTELARYLGPRVTSVDGRLASAQSDGALNVAVESVQLTDGVRQAWSGEGVVAFPSQYVTRIERSELSKARTTVGAIALVVGLFAIAALALKVTGSQGGPDAGGGSPTQ